MGNHEDDRLVDQAAQTEAFACLRRATLFRISPINQANSAINTLTWSSFPETSFETRTRAYMSKVSCYDIPFIPYRINNIYVMSKRAQTVMQTHCSKAARDETDTCRCSEIASSSAQSLCNQLIK